MKHYFILLLFHFCMVCNGQTVQNGVVWQYNGKTQKSTLPAVEIAVENAATTVSKQNGTFTLQFKSLKSGNKVNAKHIVKQGYEIFNLDAIEQWFISEKYPFNIIMCKSDEFRKIRDTYSKIANESYARQYDNDKRKLQSELAAGKLLDEEYKAALHQLTREYETQFKSINSYVDRFARIDLSSLSEKEQHLIELVQNGAMDKAIEAYEEEDYIHLYINEKYDRAKISDTKEKLEKIEIQKTIERDSIYNIIIRQVDLYKLTGGKENFIKAKQLLKACADADSANWYAIWKYACFTEDQCLYSEAIKYYNKLLGNPEFFQIIHRPTFEGILANTYREAGLLDKASSLIAKAISDEDEYLKLNPERSRAEMASLMNFAGLIHYVNGDRELGEQCLCTALDYFMKIYENEGESMDIITDIAEIEGNLGAFYGMQGKKEDATRMCEYSYKHFKKAFEADSIGHFGQFVTSENNLGLAYSEDGKSYEAEQLLISARNHFYQVYEINPSAWTPSLAMVDTNLGCLYLDHSIFERAEMFLNSALANYEMLFKNDSVIYVDDYCKSIINICKLRTSQKDFASATQYAKYAYRIQPETYHRYLSYKMIEEAKRVHLVNSEYKTCVEMMLSAIQISPEDPALYEELGSCLLLLKEVEAARIVWEKLKNVDPEYTTKYPESRLNQHFNSKQQQ